MKKIMTALVASTMLMGFTAPTFAAINPANIDESSSAANIYKVIDKKVAKGENAGVVSIFAWANVGDEIYSVALSELRKHSDAGAAFAEIVGAEVAIDQRDVIAAQIVGAKESAFNMVVEGASAEELRLAQANISVLEAELALVDAHIEDNMVAEAIANAEMTVAQMTRVEALEALLTAKYAEAEADAVTAVNAEAGTAYRSVDELINGVDNLVSSNADQTATIADLEGEISDLEAEAVLDNAQITKFRTTLTLISVRASGHTVTTESNVGQILAAITAIKTDNYNSGYTAGVEAAEMARGTGSTYQLGFDAGVASVAGDYSRGYAEGVASVTPEDGVSQADVDAAVLAANSARGDDSAYGLGFAAGAASVTPEDGVSQADVDAADAAGFARGVASVTPEDGINQSHVDAAREAGRLAGVASVTPEDGITMADVDAADAAGFARGVASVTYVYSDSTVRGQAAVTAAYTQGRSDGDADGRAALNAELASDIANSDFLSNEHLEAAYDAGWVDGVASVSHAQRDALLSGINMVLATDITAAHSATEVRDAIRRHASGQVSAHLGSLNAAIEGLTFRSAGSGVVAISGNAGSLYQFDGTTLQSYTLPAGTVRTLNEAANLGVNLVSATAQSSTVLAPGDYYINDGTANNRYTLAADGTWDATNNIADRLVPAGAQVLNLGEAYYDLDNTGIYAAIAAEFAVVTVTGYTLSFSGSDADITAATSALTNAGNGNYDVAQSRIDASEYTTGPVTTAHGSTIQQIQVFVASPDVTTGIAFTDGAVFIGSSNGVPTGNVIVGGVRYTTTISSGLTDAEIISHVQRTSGAPAGSVLNHAPIDLAGTSGSSIEARYNSVTLTTTNAGISTLGANGVVDFSEGVAISPAHLTEIQNAVNEAYSVGYDDGYSDGFKDGYVVGFSDGVASAAPGGSSN